LILEWHNTGMSKTMSKKTMSKKTILEIERDSLVKLAGPGILLELTKHLKYGFVLQFPETFFVNVNTDGEKPFIEYFRTKEVPVTFLTMNNEDSYFHVIAALLKSIGTEHHIFSAFAHSK
jgi:hypothetical protein